MSHASIEPSLGARPRPTRWLTALAGFSETELDLALLPRKEVLGLELRSGRGALRYVVDERDRRAALPPAPPDLTGLYARAWALLSEREVEVVLCGVAGVAADAVAVEALADGPRGTVSIHRGAQRLAKHSARATSSTLGKRMAPPSGGPTASGEGERKANA